MDELQMILVSAGVSFFTEVFKRVFPKTNPLFIVALISIFFGGCFAVGRHYGFLSDEAIGMIKYIFASSIIIFNVLKQMVKKDVPM